jgi:hypothetical protein
VGADENLLRTIFLVLELAPVDAGGHPLDRERGPGQGVRVQGLIEERSVLLEDPLLLRV